MSHYDNQSLHPILPSRQSNLGAVKPKPAPDLILKIVESKSSENAISRLSEPYKFAGCSESAAFRLLLAIADLGLLVSAVVSVTCF